VKKEAGSSQVAWALLTEGVTSARLESHRMRHLVTRALKLVEDSPAKEHLYEVAGDIIQAMPTRLEALETDLDRTAYALSVIGEDHLRDRLPLADRKVVDDAVEKAKPLFGPMLNRSAQRVAERWSLKVADLDPPLGWPGGPCHVIERVQTEVKNPRLREEIIDDIELGAKLSNPDAAQVYDLDVERMPEGTRFKRLLIGPHAQYRMDLRRVHVPAVRATLKSFFKAYNDAKSQKSPVARRWEEDFARSEAITWTDKKLGLTIVFAIQGADLKLVTTYWEGESDPRPPGDGGCAL
jgi:hypothetical protein